MFDKLDDILIHYEELMLMLGDPDVTQDTKRFTKLMKDVYKRQGEGSFGYPVQESDPPLHQGAALSDSAASGGQG